jgi:hypothetical protein
VVELWAHILERYQVEPLLSTLPISPDRRWSELKLLLTLLVKKSRWWKEGEFRIGLVRADEGNVEDIVNSFLM